MERREQPGVLQAQDANGVQQSVSQPVAQQAYLPATASVGQQGNASIVDFIADHTPAIIGAAGGVLALVALLLVLSGLGIFGSSTTTQIETGALGDIPASAADETPIVFDMNLEKGEKLATPVPARFIGRDSRGNVVTRTAFISGDGTGVSLPEGSYTVEFLASPISEKGHLFSVDGIELSIDVPAKVDATSGQGKSVGQVEGAQFTPIEVPLTLETADVHEFTNEELELVREYAIEGGVEEEQVEEVMAPIMEEVESQDASQQDEKSADEGDKDSGKDTDKDADKNDKNDKDADKNDKDTDKGDKDGDGKDTDKSDEDDSSKNAAPLPGEESTDDGKEAGEKSDADATDGTVFGPSQLYKGTLYVGDVRTMSGDKPVTLIPKSTTPPVEAEQFLFVDDVYYYVDNFAGNGSGAVKLHKYDLKTKKDTVLASDVLAPSKVSFVDGKIVYRTSASKSVQIAVVDAKSGSSSTIDFGEQKGLSTFWGVVDGKALVSVSLYGEPTRVLSCALVDGQVEEALTLTSDDSVAAVCNGMILVTNKGSLVGYDLKGTKAWTSTLPVKDINGSTALYAGDTVYFAENTLDSSNDFVAVKLSTGKVTAHKTGLPYSVQAVYADSKTLYFCAEPVIGSDEKAPNGMFTYALTLADDTLTKLDGEEPASDQAADEKNMAEHV